MRDYLRHPSDIPLDVKPMLGQDEAPQQLHDVSFGGLSFVSMKRYAPGSVLRIRITMVSPPFETEGLVVWCRQQQGQFLVGMRFMRPTDMYQARMVEQVCHIEHYRRQVLQEEGRKLTSQQAALEWIEKFAAEFPQSEGKDT